MKDMLARAFPSLFPLRAAEMEEAERVLRLVFISRLLR